MEVLAAIRREAVGRAVLLIEHRPERTAIADRVVRVADGRAVERVGASA